LLRVFIRGNQLGARRRLYYNRSEAMVETVLSVSLFVGIVAVSLISLTLLAIAIGLKKSDTEK